MMVRAIASSPSRGNPLGTLHNVRRRGCSTTGLPRADDVRSRLRAHVRVAGIGGPALRRRHRPPSGYRALHPRALRLPAVGRRVLIEPRAEERVQPRHGCVRSLANPSLWRASHRPRVSRAPSRRARPIPGRDRTRPVLLTLSPSRTLGARRLDRRPSPPSNPRSRVRPPHPIAGVALSAFAFGSSTWACLPSALSLPQDGDRPQAVRLPRLCLPGHFIYYHATLPGEAVPATSTSPAF